MKVERVEVKDVRVPEQLQRAMAAEAEAAREARAKVIAAEGEHKASRSLRLAAEVITDSPAALQVAVGEILLDIFSRDISLQIYLISLKSKEKLPDLIFSVEISSNIEWNFRREQQHNYISSPH